MVCFVAGTGLSGAIAIAAAFAAERHGSDARSKEDVKFSTEVSPTTSAEQAGRWQRCVVIWSVRESDYTDMPFFECTSF